MGLVLVETTIAYGWTFERVLVCIENKIEYKTNVESMPRIVWACSKNNQTKRRANPSCTTLLFARRSLDVL
jgi:hypothetical protein